MAARGRASARAVDETTGAGSPTPLALLHKCMVAYAERLPGAELASRDPISNGSLSDTIECMLVHYRHFPTAPLPAELVARAEQELRRKVLAAAYTRNRAVFAQVKSEEALPAGLRMRLDAELSERRERLEADLRTGMYLLSRGTDRSPGRGRVELSKRLPAKLERQFLRTWLLPRFERDHRTRRSEGAGAPSNTVVAGLGKALATAGLAETRAWFEAKGAAPLRDELALYQAILAKRDTAERLDDYRALLATWILVGSEPGPWAREQRWDRLWECPFLERAARPDLFQAIDNAAALMREQLVAPGVGIGAADGVVDDFVSVARREAGRLWRREEELAGATTAFAPALAQAVDAALTDWAREQGVCRLYELARAGDLGAERLAAVALGSDAAGVAPEASGDGRPAARALRAAAAAIAGRNEARRSLAWTLLVGCALGPAHVRRSDGARPSVRSVTAAPAAAPAAPAERPPLGPGAHVVLWRRAEGAAGEAPLGEVAFEAGLGMCGLILFGRRRSYLDEWVGEARAAALDDVACAVERELRALVRQALDGCYLVPGLVSRRPDNRRRTYYTAEPEYRPLPPELCGDADAWLHEQLAAWACELSATTLKRFSAAREALEARVGACVRALSGEAGSWSVAPPRAVVESGFSLQAHQLSALVVGMLARAYARLPERVYDALGTADCDDPLRRAFLAEAIQCLRAELDRGVDPRRPRDPLARPDSAALCAKVGERLDALLASPATRLVETAAADSSARHAVVCAWYGELRAWNHSGNGTQVIRGDAAGVDVGVRGAVLRRGDVIRLAASAAYELV